LYLKSFLVKKYINNIVAKRTGISLWNVVDQLKKLKLVKSITSAMIGVHLSLKILLASRKKVQEVKPERIIWKKVAT
jgi:uncharacterized protein YvpB